MWLTRLAQSCLLYTRGLRLGSPQLLAEALRLARVTSRDLVKILRPVRERVALLHTPVTRLEDVARSLQAVVLGGRPRELHVPESELELLADDLADLVLYGDATLSDAVKVVGKYLLRWLPELDLVLSHLHR